MYYYVRHPKKDEVVRIFDWVTKAAEGAALGTQTTVDYEVIGGTHDLLLNSTLAEDMQENLLRVGGVSYTSAETEFAKKLQSSFTYTVAGYRICSHRPAAEGSAGCRRRVDRCRRRQLCRADRGITCRHLGAGDAGA